MKSVLLGFAAAAALATTASAAVVTFDFQTPSGVSVASPHTYTVGGLSITATGFVSNGGATTTLFDKSGTGDENGLGLTDDPSGQNEITGTNFVQIDTSLLPAGSTFSFQAGSTQNEEWEIFGTNSAGTTAGAGFSLTGTDELVTHLLPTGFKYFDFKDVPPPCETAVCPSNVLLHTFTVTTAVPEPGTWAMMLLGIGGLGAALRFGRKSEGQAALA